MRSPWFAKIRSYCQTDLSTQAGRICLPVVTIAGLTVWTVLSGATNANSQSARPIRVDARGDDRRH